LQHRWRSYPHRCCWQWREVRPTLPHHRTQCRRRCCLPWRGRWEGWCWVTAEASAGGGGRAQQGHCCWGCHRRAPPRHRRHCRGRRPRRRPRHAQSAPRTPAPRAGPAASRDGERGGPKRMGTCGGGGGDGGNTRERAISVGECPPNRSPHRKRHVHRRPDIHPAPTAPPHPSPHPSTGTLRIASLTRWHADATSTPCSRLSSDLWASPTAKDDFHPMMESSARKWGRQMHTKTQHHAKKAHVRGRG
jgi:hypothetical protein